MDARRVMFIVGRSPVFRRRPHHRSYVGRL